MYRTTVILVNYKGAKDTGACLRSLHASDVMLRIVVVDNTPNDPDLADVMAEYPEVHLIRAPENLGFGIGNNLGIDWALDETDCEFIFNNDAMVERDTVGRLEAALDMRPVAGMVAPRVVFMDKPDVLWYGGGEVCWWRGGANVPGIFGACNAPLAMQAREVSFASGCAILLRRELMQQLAGFDERFFMYEEDLELCFRTKELGWKIRYEPTALVLHKVQASSRGDQGYVGMLSPDNHNLSFYVYHVVRNRLLNMRLHARGSHKLIYIFGFSIFILKKFAEYTLYKRWDGLSAMFRGWRSYREIGIYERVKKRDRKMLAQLSTPYVKLYPLGALRRLIGYTFFEGRPVTTRGQWINPLVFNLFWLYKRLPQLSKVRKPIFIVGSGRSGTTLLGSMFSMHRQVGFLNEPKALWHSVFANEDVIGNYSDGEANYYLDKNNVSDKERHAAHRLFGAYLAVTQSERLCDKYPELIFRIPFVQEIFPDAQFIFIVRNGWDTCASIASWSKKHGDSKGGKIHDWWGVNQRKWLLMQTQLVPRDPIFDGMHDVVRQLTRHEDMAVVEWILTMCQGMRCVKSDTSAVCMVRYEDLTNSPRKELQRLLDFTGLTEDRRYMDFAVATAHPVPEYKLFEVHPKLLPLFEQTMRELGYLARA